MLTVIAKIKVKADQAETFEAEAKKMIAHVKANEPGTLTLRAPSQHRGPDDLPLLRGLPGPGGVRGARR